MWTMNRGRLPFLRIIGTTSQKYWVLLLIITISLCQRPFMKVTFKVGKKDSFLIQTVNECSKMIMLGVPQCAKSRSLPSLEKNFVKTSYSAI